MRVGLPGGFFMIKRGGGGRGGEGTRERGKEGKREKGKEGKKEQVFIV
jgi:hypothetical protein